MPPGERFRMSGLPFDPVTDSGLTVDGPSNSVWTKNVAFPAIERKFPQPSALPIGTLAPVNTDVNGPLPLPAIRISGWLRGATGN